MLGMGNAHELRAGRGGDVRHECTGGPSRQHSQSVLSKWCFRTTLNLLWTQQKKWTVGRQKSVSQPFFGGGRALEIFSKTRILLVGFGYNETNFGKLTKLTACSWAGSGRFRGNEARSDHDLAVSLAIPCVRNML